MKINIFKKIIIIGTKFMKISIFKNKIIKKIMTYIKMFLVLLAFLVNL